MRDCIERRGGRFAIAAWVLGVAFGIAATAGCGEEGERGSAPTRHRPLQPLVYTEDPDLTAEAAAVRERRLMRRLLSGAKPKGKTWGALEDSPSENVPTLDSAEALGRVVYRALVDQSDAHWDHLFVTPRGYASLVNLKLEKARTFVDNQQADARGARRAFAVDNASERPKEGLTSIFEYRRVKLGEGRAVDGSVARGEEVVVQHWDNVVYLGLDGDASVEFRLRIPKVIRLHRRKSSGSAVRLGVASDIEIGPRLEAYLEAGMHLKPELLRSFEYPIPLAVGNFWRYSRHLRGRPLGENTEGPQLEEASAQPPTPPPSELPEGLTASEVSVKVKSIDRYGTRRLIELRIAYNDADLTRRSEYWLATPRLVFLCSRPCRRHVEDLNWLLSHLRRQTPIFRFPLGRGDAWGRLDGGGGAEGTFEVEEAWHEIEAPAGSFFGALAIHGLGPLERRVPAHRLREATRFVAPGKGVVRRTYRVGPGDEDVIVETLLDYRLMPR